MKALLICLFANLAFILFSCTDSSYKSVTIKNKLETEIEIAEVSGAIKQTLPSQIKPNESEEFEIDSDGEEIKFNMKIDGTDYLLRTGTIVDFNHFEIEIYKQNDEFYFRVNKHNQNEKLKPISGTATACSGNVTIAA